MFREVTKDTTKDGERQCVISLMGTQCNAASQEFITKAVVRLDANRDNTAQDRHENGGHVERFEHELRLACRGDVKGVPSTGECQHTRKANKKNYARSRSVKQRQCVILVEGISSLIGLIISQTSMFRKISQGRLRSLEVALRL